MKIGLVSQCTRRLSFQPRALWPAVLPAVAWNEVLVAGFDRAESSACLLVSSDEYPLEEILSSLYPNLAFTELARLFAQLETLNIKLEWPKFCSRLGHRWIDDWSVLFHIINSAPASLCDWWQEREVSARDLAPLKALPEDLIAGWYLLAQKMVMFAPSKSEGVQTLEWLVDVMLICDATARVELEKNLLQSTSYNAFRICVRQARFHQSSMSEKTHGQKVSRLPWPAKAKTAWVRHGDRDGIEIKLFLSSADELKKQIASLDHVAECWQADTNDGLGEGKQ